MKATKLIISFVLLLTASHLFAYDFEAVCPTGQTLYYNINADGASVTVTYPCHDGQYNYYYGYDMPQGDLVIPESVEFQNTSYVVTNVGAYAFYGCWAVGAVTFPNTLVTIGARAFMDTDMNGYMHHLVIPDGVVSVGSMAFSGASIHEITIGQGVEFLGVYAFNCHNLEIVHYNPANCSDLTASAFGVSFETLTIGDNVTTIPSHLFEHSESIDHGLVIPNSVVHIGEMAFYYTHVSSVVFNDNLIDIGPDAFSTCHYLTHVEFGNKLKTIGDHAFESCEIAGDIVLYDSLEYLGYGAFAANEQITTVSIGTGIQFIGGQALLGHSLTDVYIKATVPPYIGVHLNNPRIHVPCESLCDYQTDANWAQFTNIIANFPFSFSVESDDIQMGTVHVLQQPDCCYSGRVLAFPYPGYEFDCWKSNGTIVSYDELYEFEVVEDMNLVAYFKIYDEVAEKTYNIIEIYPNPSKDKITIDGVEVSKIQIFNTLGQLVKTVQSSNEINITDLPTGIYIVKISDFDENNYTNKIIIQ